MEVSGYHRGVIDHVHWQLDRGWFSQGLEIHHPSWGDGFRRQPWAQPTNFAVRNSRSSAASSCLRAATLTQLTAGGQRVVYHRNVHELDVGESRNGDQRPVAQRPGFRGVSEHHRQHRRRSDRSLGEAPERLDRGRHQHRVRQHQHSGGGSFRRCSTWVHRSWDFSRPYPIRDYRNGPTRGTTTPALHRSARQRPAVICRVTMRPPRWPNRGD